MSAAAVERSPAAGLTPLPSSCTDQQDKEGVNKEGEEVVPPSFYMLADDWNKHFVQAGEWLVSATESADSNPASDNEEEGADGKAGFASGLGFPNLQGIQAPELPESFGVNMAAVKGRASAASINVGSFFSSAFSKAGATVKDASAKIKETVEKNTLLAEFNKEQEAFISAKGGKAGEAVAPWVGYPEEEALKEEILALSTDRRNFVRAPPTGVCFEFELEAFLPVAQATLEADPNLEKMRFELVPKVINEETFWRNYFYRVGLIRQSTELSTLERESSDTTSQTANEEDKGVTKGGGKDEEVEHPESPSHVGESEFVSDSFQPSSKDLEEIKKGISNLTKPSSDVHLLNGYSSDEGEEDWEKELREELGEDLGEYEVVTGGKDNEKWEEEIQSMIDDEDGDLR
ncbi:unnamed protein product [Meganyctiphanes norvegica]|uniref:BSD domain-containing protein n=1 Tax=Meganyctiphanes norvegica TaxID=48144 RepID=A0AAV2QLG9_MEGNR